MKNIFKQMAVILLFFCLWYVFFLFLTYHFYPENTVVDNSRLHERNNRLVLGKLKSNIFLNDAQNILLGFWVTKHESKRIIIIGGSNALRINPAVMQKALPDFTINLAAVRNSNITQLRDIVYVVRKSSPGSLKGTIFIIGVCFATFFNDNASGGHVLYENKNLTFLEAEGLRYGLYKLRDNKLELVLAPRMMPLAVHLLRPFLLCDLVFYDLKSYYDNSFASLHAVQKKPQDLKGEEFKQASLAEWRDSLGNIRDFAEDGIMSDFVTLCKEIEKSGASVVIVDLPSAPWMQNESEYYKKYTLKRLLYLDEDRIIPRLRYVNLATLLPPITDGDFVDSVHPTKEEGEMWSKAIAGFVLSQRKFLGF